MASDILTLNAGSSSLKFSLWQAAAIELREIFRGKIEEIGIAAALVRARARRPRADR
jgi:acetate kinase